MQVNKIMFGRKGTGATVEYTQTAYSEATHATGDMGVKFSAFGRHKDFDDAMQALLADVNHVLFKNPEGIDYLNPWDSEVLGVTVDRKNDTLGCCVNVCRTIDGLRSPLVLESPMLKEDKTMPEGMGERVRKLINEAVFFVNGKRAPDPQGNLDLEPGDAAKDVTPLLEGQETRMLEHNPDVAAAPALGDVDDLAAADQDEALYREAVKLVTETGKASTSYLQRTMKIGYNRAHDLIDRMEAEGVVSKPNHVGKREVLSAKKPDAGAEE